MKYDPETMMQLSNAERTARAFRGDVTMSDRTHAWVGALLVCASGAITTGAGIVLAIAIFG